MVIVLVALAPAVRVLAVLVFCALWYLLCSPTGGRSPPVGLHFLYSHSHFLLFNLPFEYVPCCERTRRTELAFGPAHLAVRGYHAPHSPADGPSEPTQLTSLAALSLCLVLLCVLRPLLE